MARGAEPDAARVAGKSRDVAAVFFEDVLAMRLTASGAGAAPGVVRLLGDLVTRCQG